MNRYPIHQLTMPTHSILPAETLSQQPVQDPPIFDLPFPAPSNETEERAIAVWINSHLIFFISLNVATYAARQACIAAGDADVTALTQWVERLRVLRLASVSFTCMAANITQEVYESYIRPAMKTMRADFSGVSSPDNGAYTAEFARMKDAIGSLLPTLSAEEALPIHQALAGYGEAEKVWWSHHGEIMRRLISTPHSLARQAYQRQVEEHGKTMTYDAFKNETLRTPEALSENDRFFAVRRGAVSLTQFRRNLDHTLKVIESYRISDAVLAGYLQAGVELMVQITDECCRFALPKGLSPQAVSCSHHMLLDPALTAAPAPSSGGHTWQPHPDVRANNLDTPGIGPTPRCTSHKRKGGGASKPVRCRHEVSVCPFA